MGFYPQRVVQKVRNRRKEGLSIRQLEDEFAISYGTISRWVRDIPSKNTAFKQARQRDEQRKWVSRAVGAEFPVTRSGAKFLASLLYWCEGSKPPSSNYVAFCNSDPNLVKVFLELLRQGFQINEEKMKAYLQVHSTHDYDEVLKFWSKLLQIPPDQFHKPIVTRPTGNMKRRKYHGTCSLKYYDVKLQLEMVGIYEAFTERYGGVA